MSAARGDVVEVGESGNSVGGIVVLVAASGFFAALPLLARGHPFWMWLVIGPILVMVWVRAAGVARRRAGRAPRFWIEAGGLRLPDGFRFGWDEAAEIYVYCYRVHGDAHHMLCLRANAPALIAERRRTRGSRADDGSLAVSLDRVSLPWEEIVEIVRSRSGRSVPVQEGALRDFAQAHPAGASV